MTSKLPSQTVIDALDDLDESCLLALNDIICERIRQAQDRRRAIEACRFRVGQRVSFNDRNGRTVSGTIDRINKKSISVEADSGLRWRVSPCYIRAADVSK